MPTSINLPRPTLDALSALAKARGWSRSQLVAHIVEQYLRRTKNGTGRGSDAAPESLKGSESNGTSIQHGRKRRTDH